MNSNLVALVEKTTDFDKDERYMATSDLCHELQQLEALPRTIEDKCCHAVLNQLDDKSNDVQAIAVKCLGIIVTKVQPQRVREICDRLGQLILDGKPELRDIYAIGLKTILSGVDQGTGAMIAAQISARLAHGISTYTDPRIQAECLEILTELLARFGRDLAQEHAHLMEILLTQIPKDNATVKKRTVACIGELGKILSDENLNRMIEQLLKETQIHRDNTTNVRVYIQTIGTLSKTVGHRLGQHLPTIAPIFLQFCGNADDENLQNEAGDDLRENCLQGFQSFLLRCTKEITPYISDILEISLTFMTYDPNYNYDFSGDEDETMEEEEEEEEFSEEEDYSDDDDTSWKVRRASLAVLGAIISSRPDLLDMVFEKCSEPLIKRFKEREEAVRIDIFLVYSKLLNLFIVRSQKLNQELQKGSDALASIPSATLLSEQLSSIVSSANKQLGPKSSVQARCAVLSMLRELVKVERGKLNEEIQIILPSIIRSLNDKSANLKLEALQLLIILLQTHSPLIFKSYIESIVSAAVKCIDDEWYKVVAKSLFLTEVIVHVLRPSLIDESLISESSDLDFQPHVETIYNAVFPKLQLYDIDQSIKENAISAMGCIVSVFGDHLGNKVSEIFPLYMERLQNETTRIPVMKALAVIARSKLTIDMSSIMSECVSTLSQRLRQQSRTLKQCTLDTLEAIVLNKGNEIEPKLLYDVVREASVLINDVDLQLCQLSLSLLSEILDVCPEALSNDCFLMNALPNILEISKSALLQSQTLAALSCLYTKIVQLKCPKCDYQYLINSLSSLDTNTEISKSSMINLSKSIIVITLNAPENGQTSIAQSLLSEIGNASSEEKKVLSLYCLGEFGKRRSLREFGQSKELILKCLNDNGENIKASAAYALGNICVCNTDEYLDTIIGKLNEGTNVYFLLSSIKEVINAHFQVETFDLRNYMEKILPVLQLHCQSEEEGIRTMVADCFGKLSVVDPSTIFPVLAQMYQNQESNFTRWTAVTSIKYCLLCSSVPLPFDHLKQNLPIFLGCLRDSDLDVRKASLLTLNSVAHHQPHLLTSLEEYSHVFDALLEGMEIKLERKVDLGPFKHRIDDGLPVRKGAYSCVNTLVKQFPPMIDLDKLFPYIKAGLEDTDEIKMVCHQIIKKLCLLNPGAVIDGLDMLLEPLEKSINKSAKSSNAGTEVDRVNDLITSALRAVFSISQIRGSEMHPRFRTLQQHISSKPNLAVKLSTIQSEAEKLSTITTM